MPSESPFLPETEVRTLICQAQGGDREAFARVIEQVKPFVYKLARQYSRRVGGVPIEDLVQVGLLAAVRSVPCFDPAAGVKFNNRAIRGLGNLSGLGSEFLDTGTEVAKLGRTTGLTRGRVTAFELDNVVVGFDIGNLRFDNQIEIEGASTAPFSQGGDSGSLIFSSQAREAVALLFAGSDQGGSNGKGLTFANPMGVVLEQLKAELVAER